MAAIVSAQSGTFRFRPVARLQKYLGNELIADSNLAVIEFVKNAYDSGASHVTITIKASGEGVLTIADNGIGMTAASFEQNWMQPGFSTKSPEAPAELRQTPPSNSAGRRQSARVAVGEKGLGRLAAGRLGEVLEVYTREASRTPWLHVTFNWPDFEKMTVPLDEVPVPFDASPPPFDPPFGTGTVVVIRRLRLKWDARVPGRKVLGRSDTRLGRLKQDLELLLRPIGGGFTDFNVTLESDSIVNADDVGNITPRSSRESSDYHYEFEVATDSEDRVTIHRRLKRSATIVKEFGGVSNPPLPTVVLSSTDAQLHGLPRNLSCGPFRGHFFYDPPPKARRATAVTAVGHGVLLYRDGVLVEPYGLDQNDWVGVEARKAQRQGHAPIQPNTFSGEVHIAREANPSLVDLANRQGLIDNGPARAFVSIVQEEFDHFESLVGPEVAQRWQSLSQRASERAADRIELASVQMKAVAHALRQPLFGLAADLKSLANLIRTRDDLPADVLNDLRRLQESSSNYVNRAEGVLKRLAVIEIPDPTPVSTQHLIDQTIADVISFAEDAGVSIRIGRVQDRTLLIPYEVVFEALSELIRNGIEAPRQDGAEGRVHLSTRVEQGDLVVEIADDGSGLSEVSVGTPLDRISLNTKGRPAEGLSMVHQAITLARGRVVLARTGSTGTQFDLYLPDRLDGLRR